MSVSCELERKIYTEHILTHAGICTDIHTASGRRTGGCRLRIHTRIAGESEEIIQRNEQAELIDEDLLGPLLRNGVTELDLLDLEERAVEDGSGRTPEIHVARHFRRFRELGIRVLLTPRIQIEVIETVVIAGTVERIQDLAATLS